MNESTENTFLQIKHLAKIYPNGEKAVYDFNLDIEKNEFIVIVGPSGCGKSTTLRMIAGLEDISSGDVIMDGELLNYKACKDRKMAIVFQSYALYPQMTVYDNIAFPLTINAYPYPVVNLTLLSCSQIREAFETQGEATVFEVLEGCTAKKAQDRYDEIAARLGIGYVAAERLYDLYRTVRGAAENKNASEAKLAEKMLTALDAVCAKEREKLGEKNTRLNDNFEELDESGNVIIAERKMTDYEVREKVYQTADILDLVPYLDKLPKELSGGQMQRVALGRAIVKNVPVFLMDEPLSNLDAKLRLTMRSEIVQLHNRINATTIYVTHDQTEAMTMASRIVIMSKGFIQQIGTPEEIYNAPANIFVARFIGAPPMNILEVSFNKEAGTLSYHQLKVNVGADFVAKHDDFYTQKARQFAHIAENYGDETKDALLKVLSATGEVTVEKYPHAEQKQSLLARIRRTVAAYKDRNSKHEDPNKATARQKYRALQECLEKEHTLLMGIRPERIRIEKYDPSHTHENCIVQKPVVCELLGSEYNVHFNYFGKKLIVKTDAKNKITKNDEFALWFATEDTYIFDPVTGDAIV